MKFNKTLLVGVVAASTLAAGVFSTAANAEVVASAGVASLYYWRGFDLGGGIPQVSGDIHYTESGFTAGIWGGSGDTNGGSETDLYAGYAGGEADGFNYDVTAWTYAYPNTKVVKGETVEPKPAGKLSEVVVGLGYGPVKFTYYSNIAGAPGYSYVTLAGTMGAFSATLGKHNKGMDDATHLDLGYAYNDRLKFTLGKVLKSDESAAEDEPRFVVSYTLPLEN